MSTCPKCKVPIPPDAKFCTECGMPALAPPDVADPCMDEAHTALAAANLLKLHGEWQAAIDKCMQVLALDEDDAAAHSLLGDIYRDQGHFSEAMHWYKLALDLNPDSPADKTKLEQTIAGSLIDRLPKRDRKAEAIVTAKRVLLEAALAIGLLLVITTVWPVIFRPKLGSEMPQRPPETPQRVRLPVGTTEGAEPSQVPANQPVGASMSSREDAILRALNASPALTRHGLEARVILIDPRNRSAAITLVCPQTGDQPASETLVRGSLIVLREACLKEHGLDQFTIRAVYDRSDGSADVRFVANAQRNSVLLINPESADYSQLVDVLQSPWWATGK